MEAKVCLVTGASSGIGRATAASLARSGATVIMVSRNKTRGEKARDEIRQTSQNRQVDVIIADISLMSSVRSLVSDFEARGQPLQVLVNDAAVYTGTRTVTSEGFELMFATNYLGPFLLTRLLLPHMEEAGPSRIINVTAPSTTRPIIDDLQGERRFGALTAFGASKAADLLFTYSLARRLAGRKVTVNAYHPGLVRTSLMHGAAAPIRFMSGMMNLLVGTTPERASEGVTQLAMSEEFAHVSGQLVHKGKMISAPFAEDKDLQESLWKTSCGLVGLPENP